MTKHFIKIVFSALLITFSYANFVKAETIIRVVDWQSGVGGITNSYADFIKDPIATMETIYDFIDKPFEESIKIKMESYIKNHKKHKHGKHHYSLKDYGLTEEIIEDRIASKWQIN